MPVSIAHTRLALTGTCPTCSDSFESCRCGARPGLAVQAGSAKEVAKDMERDDNNRGYEREPEARLHQLVQHLVADGDRRARTVGRPARRTREQMAPGHQPRELLTMTGTAHDTGGRPVRGGEAAVA
ncbi:hypothetical protein ACFUT3_31920 [Streptomyces cinereoruber]|uniref:hypothetical protein n=1 Tax=Streptomyces cinereoruber TaxID=67260 RepID=UPI00362E3153